MRNVTRSLLILPLLAVPALTACTKASPEVLSLTSFALPALKPETDPFNGGEGAADKGYIVLSGQCVSEVTGFELQFDEMPWVPVPGSPEAPLNGVKNGFAYAENDPAADSHVYDLNCADGKFKFWFYLHQADAWISQTLGRQVTVSGDGTDGYHPRTIRVRGTSPLFYTEPITFNTGEKDDSGAGAPVSIALTQQSMPLGAAVADRCLEVEVSLRDSRGNHATAGQDVDVSVSYRLQSGATTSRGATILWTSRDGCEQNVTAARLSGGNVRVPASRSRVVVAYRPADNGGAAGASLTLKPSATGTWTGTHRDLSVTLHAGTDRYIAMSQLPWFGVRDACYPLGLQLRRMDQQSFTSSAAMVSVTAADSRVKVYLNAACTDPLTPSTSVAVDAYAGVVVYVKGDAGTEALSTRITASGQGGEVPGLQDITLMSSDANVPARAVIAWGPAALRRDNQFLHETFAVQLQNAQGATLVANAARSVSVSLSGAGAGSFHRPEDCDVESGTQRILDCDDPLSTLDFAAGEVQKNYVFLASVAGAVRATLGGSGLTSTLFDFAVRERPSLAMTFVGGTYAHGSCVRIDLELRDPAKGVAVAAATPGVLNVSGDLLSATRTLHSEDSCSAGTVLGAGVSWPQGISQVSVWLKANNPAPAWQDAVPSASFELPGAAAVALSGLHIAPADDPCLSTENPGETCRAGAQYLGVLSGRRLMVAPPPDCLAPDYTTCGADTNEFKWSNIEVATGVNSGTDGALNLANLLVLQENNVSFETPAASACEELEAGGYDDWYLPSKYELQLLLSNKHLMRGLVNMPYWSSTESNSTKAYAANMSTASMVEFSKTDATYVRCVRTIGASPF